VQEPYRVRHDVPEPQVQQPDHGDQSESTQSLLQTPPGHSITSSGAPHVSGPDTRVFALRPSHAEQAARESDEGGALQSQATASHRFEYWEAHEVVHALHEDHGEKVHSDAVHVPTLHAWYSFRSTSVTLQIPGGRAGTATERERDLDPAQVVRDGRDGRRGGGARVRQRGAAFARATAEGERTTEPPTHARTKARIPSHTAEQGVHAVHSPSTQLAGHGSNAHVCDCTSVFEHDTPSKFTDSSVRFRVLTPPPHN
jgi:hypothetical protein